MTNETTTGVDALLDMLGPVCGNCGCFKAAHDEDEGEFICPPPGTRFSPKGEVAGDVRGAAFEMLQLVDRSDFPATYDRLAAALNPKGEVAGDVVTVLERVEVDLLNVADGCGHRYPHEQIGKAVTDAIVRVRAALEALGSNAAETRDEWTC